MRAISVDKADPAIGVAESDQILAEQAQAHRRTVLLGQFDRQAGGLPIAAEELARGGATTDPDQTLVILTAQHRPSPRFFIACRYRRPAIGEDARSGQGAMACLAR